MKPLDTWLIVDRLKCAIEDIGLAADLAAVQNLRDFRTPSLYVVFPSERAAGAYTATPACSVSVDCDFGVVLALRNYRSFQLGGQVADESRRLIGRVRSTLQGWSPGRGYSRIAWQEGSVLRYDESVFLWVDRFAMHYKLVAEEIDDLT